jgi:hypothetical protein
MIKREVKGCQHELRKKGGRPKAAGKLKSARNQIDFSSRAKRGS